VIIRDSFADGVLLNILVALRVAGTRQFYRWRSEELSGGEAVTSFGDY